MKLKKLFILLSLVFVVGTTMGIEAYASSQSVNITYKTYGSGNGHSSGKKNHVWHYLHGKHHATLKVTYRSGKKANHGYAYLYRKSVFFDKGFGKVKTTYGNHKWSKKLDKTSGEYYLVFLGGQASTTQKVKGYIHD